MEIDLDLSRHCIKTEIKRQYDKFISEYFKTKDPDLEDKIEFLKEVLENIDLIGLRGRFQELAGNCEGDVQVVLESDRLFKIKINRETIWSEYLPEESS